MEVKKINNLIELLEELQNKEFWNDENLLNLYDKQELEETEIENDVNLDLYTATALLVRFLQKNYITQDLNAWSIQK